MQYIVSHYMDIRYNVDGIEGVWDHSPLHLLLFFSNGNTDEKTVLKGRWPLLISWRPTLRECPAAPISYLYYINMLD